VTPCSLVKRYWNLEVHVASTFFYLEEGSSRLFWNAGMYLPYYTVSHQKNTRISFSVFVVLVIFTVGPSDV
jgi:hypothetical protein